MPAWPMLMEITSRILKRGLFERAKESGRALDHSSNTNSAGVYECMRMNIVAMHSSEFLIE